MDQTQPKHLSPWIAWSIVILAFGIGLFCVWYYYFQVGVAWDNSVTNFLNIKHKTATPATTPTTTSTSATADWKTYTNSTYGFSFKYPKDWTVKESSDSDGSPWIIANSNSAVKGDGEFEIKISSLSIDNLINKDFITAYGNAGSNETWNAFVSSDVQKYSATGKKVVRTSNDGSQSYTIYVLTNPNATGVNKTIRISGETTAKDVPENKMNSTTVTEIASTFQFTK